jgi:nucleoside 2-deoxyribosyltransferase
MHAKRVSLHIFSLLKNGKNPVPDTGKTPLWGKIAFTTLLMINKDIGHSVPDIQTLAAIAKNFEMRKLKCFIACAFGRQDVDSIYNKVIKTTLQNLNINPLRVDKVNHNDKIDRKIIDLINECDFAIADLTYARPSVYYEAGFVEGLNKRVIYLARRDHTRPKADDVEGNTRIHFDLITQNIIMWGDNLQQVSRTLSKRINLVTKPLLTKRDIDLEELNSHKEFERKSIVEKVNLLKAVTPPILTTKKIKLEQSNWGNLFGQRGKGIARTVFYCDFYFTIKPTYLRHHWYPFENPRLKKYKDFNKAFGLIVTLNKLTSKTIQMNLPHYTQIGDSKTFTTKTMDNKEITLAFVDGIKSENDYKHKLKEILMNL